MFERISRSDRGTGLVEYALLVAVLAVGSLAAVSTVGESTSETFQAVADESLQGEPAAEESELTPDELWQKAKDDYKLAIDDAKSTKSADIADATAAYKEAKKNNASLPKKEKKAANKQAKQDFNQAKKNANSTYKQSVKAAKAAKSAAKAKWKATK